MRRGGTHITRPAKEGGVGAQLKRHPPTQQLINTRENKTFPLKTTNPLLAPSQRGTHHFEKRQAPPPPYGYVRVAPRPWGRVRKALRKGLV